MHRDGSTQHDRRAPGGDPRVHPGAPSHTLDDRSGNALRTARLGPRQSPAGLSAQTGA